MYKYFIIIAIFLGSLFSMETVAIIDLEPFGVSANDAKALTQRLTSQMIQIGKYTIVERSEMKRLLDEQKFQYSGCVDVACAVEIGKMLGAKTMVVGSVSKVGTVYSVDARMIDVKSAENYISADYTTTDDIGDLLIEGMKSIAYQLCEKKYTKSNLKITPNKIAQRPKYIKGEFIWNDRYLNLFDDYSSRAFTDREMEITKFIKQSAKHTDHLIMQGNPAHFLVDVKIKNKMILAYYNLSVEDPISGKITKLGEAISLNSGLQEIQISSEGYKTLIDTVVIDPNIVNNYEYNLQCLTTLRISNNFNYETYINGDKITSNYIELDPGSYQIKNVPKNSNYEEVIDEIIIEECKNNQYALNPKTKKGVVSFTVKPKKADVKIDGTVFENNSLFDYGKHRYKVSHPYHYTQTSSFTLSAPTYEENIILKSGKKDFQKLRKRKKITRIASIVSLVGLGISYYLHEDAFDKYNSATTPEDATKYRDLFNNTYNVQMAFGGLSAVSVLYTINLESKFSKLKKALSIKNQKKKKNPKQKKKQKQKQNKNRKRNK